jgi:hypothetical protein
MRSRGGLRTHPCSTMPTRISPPPNALVGLSFSPSTAAPTTTTVISSQLAMIAQVVGPRRGMPLGLAYCGNGNGAGTDRREALSLAVGYRDDSRFSSCALTRPAD